MRNPEDMSMTELQAVLERRRKVEAERLALQAEAMRQLAFSQVDALLALVPHGRTSCSDENPLNGMGTYSWGGARCDRCALLEIKEAGYWFEGFSMNLGLPPISRP